MPMRQKRQLEPEAGDCPPPKKAKQEEEEVEEEASEEDVPVALDKEEEGVPNPIKGYQDGVHRLSVDPGGDVNFYSGDVLCMQFKKGEDLSAYKKLIKNKNECSRRAYACEDYYHIGDSFRESNPEVDCDKTKYDTASKRWCRSMIKNKIVESKGGYIFPYTSGDEEKLVACKVGMLKTDRFKRAKKIQEMDPILATKEKAPPEPASAAPAAPPVPPAEPTPQPPPMVDPNRRMINNRAISLMDRLNSFNF